jgi:uncharacterized protein (TIGR03437 family)
MGPRFTRLLSLSLFLAFTFRANSQTPTTCAVSAVPPTVRSEGLTERMGDIVLQCSGTPGATVSGNLSVTLPATITNRINANSMSTDANLSISTGTGSPTVLYGLVTNQSISFNGFSFILPSSGPATLTITDLRADVNELGLIQQMPIKATLGSNALLLNNNPLIVAYAQQGLLATITDSAVTCTGSPTPASVSLTSLFATGTAEETTRVTEGFAGAFQPKDPTTDTGTRFLLTFTNFPSDATIYVPDAVAGSSATLPASGGQLGTAAAVGEYTPNSGTLLLVRVLNTDSNGAGGNFATLPAANASGVLVLNGANPVTLSGGAGYAVYEVVDTNPSLRQNAQIPTFFGIPAYPTPTVANLAVSLAPISTVTTASTTAPIPRFASVQPPSDCAVFGDCGALPSLQVTLQPMQTSVVAGGKSVIAAAVVIQNTGGGVLDWSASVTNGASWLLLTAQVGSSDDTDYAIANPTGLAPGTYEAKVLVNAGSFGTQTVTITLTVTAASTAAIASSITVTSVTNAADFHAGPVAPGTYEAKVLVNAGSFGAQTVTITLTVTAASTAAIASSITVTSVTNAADFHAGPVAPGSLAAIIGKNLSGQNVAVTFDGVAADLLYVGATQINLRVPAALSGKTSSQMVVTADGASSAPTTVQLAAIAPALFSPGVLNQDNTVNGTANPAAPESVIQIFGTGLPDSGGTVVVQIQNQSNLVPLYAGAAPGLPGIEQVNVAIPAGLVPGPASLTICAIGAGNQRYCSQPEQVTLQ